MYMKIIKISIIGALLTTFLSISSINAAQYHNPIQHENENENIVNEMFSGLKDDDLVLEIEEGSFLAGPGVATYTNLSTGEVIAEYNVYSDENSITVNEAKDIILEEMNNPSTTYRGANPPSSNTLITLNYGQIYYSNKFSGSGWRFSEHQFKAKSGSGGDYLRWRSFIDSGRVGNYNEGYATKNSGTIQGTTLNVDQYVWNSEGSLGQIYFTYNPLAGTYYEVANING